MYFHIKKADYIKAPSQQGIPESLNASRISKIRCYLNSLLRDVTDNSSQVYTDRYIGFRVRTSKYVFSHGDYTSYRDMYELPGKLVHTTKLQAREHFRCLLCASDCLSLSYVALHRIHSQN